MKHFKNLLWMLLLGWLPFTGYSQHIKTLSGNRVSVATLEQRVEHLMDSLGMPAVSLAIINDGSIAYHGKFGVVNAATQQAVQPQSMFEAASLSKPLFAYFVMDLVAKGQLDLHQPIYEHLKAIIPEAAFEAGTLEAYQTITPKMVLAHQTGMPNWAKGKPIRIAFTPGTDFSYSGEAYQHLGAAVGTKLNLGWGKALDSLFIENVAKPLGMKRSFYTWNDTTETWMVKGHLDGKPNMNVNRHKKVGPGYSLMTDAYDYALFLIEMISPKQLPVNLRDEMLQEHTAFQPDHSLRKETGQTGWGLGFAQKPTPYGMMHLHTGNNHDAQSYAMFVPDHQYGFVLFGNAGNLLPLLNGLETLIEEQF